MRAAIFIDGAHLLKQIGDARITPDYARLTEYFLAPLRRNIPLDLLRCYFYYCPPWMSERPTDEELRRKANWDRFIAELEDLDRWQVRLGKLERRREGDKEVFSQKRVDVLLSVDMVRHAAAGHIQHAVLVAGDSDFIPAVEAVKESGTTLTLWAATDRSAHLDLIHSADELQYLRWKNFPQKSREASRNAPPPPELGRNQRAQQQQQAQPPQQAAQQAPATLVAIEGGAAADDGQPGKKKRRGRRGGRNRNKNRGLTIAEAGSAPAGGEGDGRDEADEPSSPATIVARAPVPAAEPAEPAEEAPVTWRYADEPASASRAFAEPAEGGRSARNDEVARENAAEAAARAAERDASQEIATANSEAARAQMPRGGRGPRPPRPREPKEQKPAPAKPAAAPKPKPNPRRPAAAAPKAKTGGKPPAKKPVKKA